jgi:hypothetical protein
MEPGLGLTYNEDIIEIAKKTGERRSTVWFYIERFSGWIKDPDALDDEDNLVKLYTKLYNRYGNKTLARTEVGRRIKLAREIRKLREMILEQGKLSGCHGSQTPWDTIFTAHASIE